MATPIQPDRRPGLVVHAIIAVLVVATAVADYLTPLGIAVWILYLAPLVLCTLVRQPSAPVVVALASLAGIALTTFTDASGIRVEVALTNRALGVAIIVLVAVLVRQIILARLADEGERWLQHRRAALVEVVQGELEPAQLGDLALRNLADATGAQIGAFYLAENGVARLSAWLALDRAAAPAEHGPGDGLIGQALRDRRPVAVDDVPADQFRIEAGLSSAPPRHVLVAPLWANRPAGRRDRRGGRTGRGRPGDRQPARGDLRPLPARLPPLRARVGAPPPDARPPALPAADHRGADRAHPPRRGRVRPAHGVPDHRGQRHVPRPGLLPRRPQRSRPGPRHLSVAQAVGGRLRHRRGGLLPGDRPGRGGPPRSHPALRDRHQPALARDGRARHLRRRARARLLARLSGGGRAPLSIRLLHGGLRRDHAQPRAAQAHRPPITASPPTTSSARSTW